jgi:hypothetical protein
MTDFEDMEEVVEGPPSLEAGDLSVANGPFTEVLRSSGVL